MLMSRSTKTIVTAIVAVVVVIGIGVGASLVANSYLSSQKTDCTTKGIEHVVRIKDNHVVPEHTDGKRCDTLKIINEDNTQRLIAFGRHDRHVAYDGVAERYVSQNQSVEVTLISVGDYLFHDHDDDEVFGTFSVSDN